jgi:hypothetical protein
MSSQGAIHAAACQANLWGNIVARPSPSLLQPWDIDDKDTSMAYLANSSVATSSNLAFEERGIDRIQSGQNANQFSIKHTTEHFTKV